jgi:DNA primase
LLPLPNSLKESLAKAVSKYEADVSNQSPYDYLQDRGINPDTVQKFRLGYVVDPEFGHERYRGRLAIPALLGSGQPYGLRFRALTPEDTPKYLGLPGLPTRLFNVRAIEQAESFICITEGELDTIILDQCGLYSVGVCGAENWKRHHPKLFAGFQRVLIFGDGDEAGQRFAEKVNISLTGGARVMMKSNQDVNDVYREGGRDAIMELVNRYV